MEGVYGLINYHFFLLNLNIFRLILKKKLDLEGGVLRHGEREREREYDAVNDYFGLKKQQFGQEKVEKILRTYVAGGIVTSAK